MTALATTLQAFFTDRLIRQRQVSPNTVQAYRDTLRLLLVFASERCGKPPGKLDIDDLDAPLIGAFLNHLEHERQNGVRTRNARLAAIRSLFRYAALRHPEHAATIERVLAIPPKRFERRLVTWLTEAEIDALLAAPDRTTWTGRRDTALFGLAVQTGLRASELIGLTRALDGFSVPPAGGQVDDLEEEVPWHVMPLELVPGYSAAIAAKGGAFVPVWQDAAQLTEWAKPVQMM